MIHAGCSNQARFHFECASLLRTHHRWVHNPWSPCNTVCSREVKPADVCTMSAVADTHPHMTRDAAINSERKSRRRDGTSRVDSTFSLACSYLSRSDDFPFRKLLESVRFDSYTSIQQENESIKTFLRDLTRVYEDQLQREYHDHERHVSNWEKEFQMRNDPSLSLSLSYSPEISNSRAKVTLPFLSPSLLCRDGHTSIDCFSRHFNTPRININVSSGKSAYIIFQGSSNRAVDLSMTFVFHVLTRTER